MIFSDASFPSFQGSPDILQSIQRTAVWLSLNISQVKLK